MADFETSSITVKSFIRGYHVYKDVADWDPQHQEGIVLKCEPNNKKDNNAVAVVRSLISLDISEIFFLGGYVLFLFDCIC